MSYHLAKPKGTVKDNPFSFPFLNLFSTAQPGIYEIYCKPKNKRYIGEARNVLDRIAKHSRMLMSNSGECTQLQLDWTELAIDKFEVRILYCGPEWIDKDKRLEKEKAIIASYQHNEVYNVHPGDSKEKVDNFSYICEIKAVRYNSVYEASQRTREKEKYIANKLQNGVKDYVITVGAL